MTAETRIYYDNEVVRAGAWNGVLFEIWQGAASPHHFRDLSRLHYDQVLTQPDRKVAMFSVVRMSNFGSFDGEARKELEARSKRLDGHTRASVVVLPAQGFAASVVRGILTGLMRASGSKVPMRVSPSAEDGFAWLAPQLPARAGRPIAPDDLRRAYESIADSVKTA